MFEFLGSWFYVLLANWALLFATALACPDQFERLAKFQYPGWLWRLASVWTWVMLLQALFLLGMFLMFFAPSA